MAAPLEGTPADASPNTVAPSVLEERAPSVRYIDPAQSNIIMESGTKSPTVRAASAVLQPTVKATRYAGQACAWHASSPDPQKNRVLTLLSAIQEGHMRCYCHACMLTICSEQPEGLCRLDCHVVYSHLSSLPCTPTGVPHRALRLPLPGRAQRAAGPVRPPSAVQLRRRRLLRRLLSNASARAHAHAASDAALPARTASPRSVNPVLNSLLLQRREVGASAILK